MPYIDSTANITNLNSTTTSGVTTTTTTTKNTSIRNTVNYLPVPSRIYPVQPSSSNRYFLNFNNSPIFLIGSSHQGMMYVPTTEMVSMI